MKMQKYADRKDESLGMKDGKESMKSQSYKSRRKESYGMGKVMGHEKAPKKCDPFGAQKKQMHRGYPKEAYAYDY